METNVTIDPEKDLLYVTDVDIDFILNVIPFILKTPPLHLELYMWWNTIYAMVMSTSMEIADFIDKQLDIFGSKVNYVARSR